MADDLSGKLVLATGGGSEIGRATAEVFVGERTKVGMRDLTKVGGRV